MNISILKSTVVVAFSTFLSRIMGLIRDMVIGSIFGATGYLDGFWVAFRIPNLFRRLVAEGCLTISFIPVYTEYLLTKGPNEALLLAQKTLSILVIILAALVSLSIIFSPAIVSIFGYGLSDSLQILTVSLNRIMFPYLFLVSIVAFAMGYLNSHKYFFSAAFSPVLLNAGFLIGAIVLRHYFDIPLFGLALGVIFGGILQVLFQIPYLIRAGFRFKFSVDLKHPGIRAIYRMIGPAIFGIAIYQINTLMSTMLASMLPSGSITYIYMSDRLTELVFGIFVFSLGNVVLPELSEYSALENFKKIKELYISSIKTSLFIAVPASIALMAAGLPIVSVLFMRGNFTPYAAEMTYKALFYASMGIPSVAIVRMTVPAFYSLKETKIPVISSGASFIINIGLGYFLMHTGLKHGGLTLSLSIATAVQMLILLFFLQRKIRKIGYTSLLVPLIKFAVSGIIMALCIHFISNQINWLNDSVLTRVQYLIILIISGIFIYFLICYFLKVREIHVIKDIIIKRLTILKK